MKLRWNTLMTIFPTVAGVLLLAPALAADNASTLSRTPDGQPNVEGYWDPETGGTFSLTNPSRGGVGLQEDLGVAVEKKPSRVVDPPTGRFLINLGPGPMLDGRPHVGASVKLWMGDSRGHWEGNMLVVDVTSYNGRSRLSNVGDFASEKAHIVERSTFVDNKTLKYEATVDDPSVYTRPWTLASVFHRGHTKERNYEQWEEACHEGERNVADSILEGTK